MVDKHRTRALRATAKSRRALCPPFGQLEMMQFTCVTCGKKYDGLPCYGADRPDAYWDVPENKRQEDVFLTSDSCVIANRFFFIRGCIKIPVIGTNDHLEWGVWVSLKDENFFIWQDNYDTPKRDHIGPFFGWLSTLLPAYPDTLHMKTMVHLRDNGVRPNVIVESTDHPLSVEQHNGISMERVQEIVDFVEHHGKQETEQLGGGDAEDRAPHP
jgi:hypothetical protein